MRKETDYIDLIIKIFLVLATILVIYWFIQIMLGGSPTTEQFIIGIILVLVGLIVNLYYASGKFNQFVNGTFSRFEKNIENSFNKTKDDMNSLNENMLSIKDDINLIKRKLKI